MELRVINALGKDFSVSIPYGASLNDLRLAVKQSLSLTLPNEELYRLKIVHQGSGIVDDQSVSRLNEKDTILAAVAPRPPSQRIRDLINNDNRDPEDEDATVDVFRLPPVVGPQWLSSIIFFLKDRLNVPEAILAVLVHVSIRVWVGIVVFMLLSRVMYFVGLGPPFIVGSLMILLFGFVGFSKRKEGSLSGYSIFNPNLERLPGQLTAEHLDGQLRRGQM